MFPLNGHLNVKLPLKQLLALSPVLAYPQVGLDAEFILETDAIGVGLGAVLSQKLLL